MVRELKQPETEITNSVSYDLANVGKFVLYLSVAISLSITLILCGLALIRFLDFYNSDLVTFSQIVDIYAKIEVLKIAGII